MKKAVLLFALSFVLVNFLSAQNDCTGNTTKAKKDNPAYSYEANHTGSTDCSKPDKTPDYYKSDEFAHIVVKKAGTKPVESWGFVVPNPNMSVGGIPFSRDQGDLFSASGSRYCCAPPPEYPRYNPAKAH